LVAVVLKVSMVLLLFFLTLPLLVAVLAVIQAIALLMAQTVAAVAVALQCLV
jgi:hypothetical protein